MYNEITQEQIDAIKREARAELSKVGGKARQASMTEAQKTAMANRMNEAKRAKRLERQKLTSS